MHLYATCKHVGNAMAAQPGFGFAFSDSNHLAEIQLGVLRFRDIFFLDGTKEKTKLEEPSVSTLKWPFCGNDGSPVS